MKMITVALAGLAVALAACTREERADAGGDVEAAAGRVAEETREAFSSPELKELGSEIREAAGDVGEVAKGAARGARDAAADVEARSRQETPDAAKE